MKFDLQKWREEMQRDTELEQLKLLFDYTKFHIGLYTTIATIMAALIASNDALFKFNWNLLEPVLN